MKEKYAAILRKTLGVDADGVRAADQNGFWASVTDQTLAAMVFAGWMKQGINGDREPIGFYFATKRGAAEIGVELKGMVGEK